MTKVSFPVRKTLFLLTFIFGTFGCSAVPVEHVSVSTEALMLDSMPQPKLAVWRSTINSSFSGPVESVSSGIIVALYDQSGNGNDLAGSSGPRAVTEGSTPAAQFHDGSDGAQKLSRSDALSLASDPSLTIAWKSLVHPVLTNIALYPTILSIGTSGDEELNIYFAKSGNYHYVIVSDSELNNNLAWYLPDGALADWHSFVLTRPSGTGYSSDWKLSVDGDEFVAGDPDFFNSGDVSLGGGSTIFGSPGAGLGSGITDPFTGRAAGLIIWDSVLSGADMSTLQSFLASQ